MNCLDTSFNILIYRRIHELKSDRDEYLIKSSQILSLRGGGCGGSKNKSRIK